MTAKQRFIPEVQDGRQWLVEQVEGREPIRHGPFESWGEAKQFMAALKRRQLVSDVAATQSVR